MAQGSTKALLGLVEHRPSWSLTRRGWLVLLLWTATTAGAFVLWVRPFLAHTDRIDADILVVEGWGNDRFLEDAAREFNNGGYRLVITTGGPLSRGHHLERYRSHAELAAATLRALGIEADRVVAVPAPAVLRDRTLASARAVRDWLKASDAPAAAINLYSEDVHTRRSWSIFTHVLSPEVRVGAIAHPPVSYEPDRWWASSAGVRSIIGETIAFVYATLFSPG